LRQLSARPAVLYARFLQFFECCHCTVVNSLTLTDVLAAPAVSFVRGQQGVITYSYKMLLLVTLTS